MGINASNLVAPGLQAFYNKFSTTASDPMFTIAQNHRFVVMMWPQPALDVSNPLTVMLGSIMASSVADAIKGESPIMPYNFLTLLVRSTSLPNFDVVGVDDDRFPTDYGYITFPGQHCLPSDNKFSLTFLDTELSPLDTFFSYWLAQTTAQKWAYTEQPYTIATFIIAPIGECQNTSTPLIGGTIVPKQLYAFTRCFPSSIQLPKFDMEQGDSIPTRDVEFKFSKMFVIPNITGFAEWATSLVS